MSVLKGLSPAGEFAYKQFKGSDYPMMRVPRIASGDLEMGTIVKLDENGLIEMVTSEDDVIYGVVFDDYIADGERGMVAITGHFMKSGLIVGDEVDMDDIRFEPRPCLFLDDNCKVSTEKPLSVADVDEP